MSSCYFNVCLSRAQLLTGPSDAAELHNGVKSPGETKHQLGS